MADKVRKKQGQNKAFIENQFKKGVCSNPNGRPKETPEQKIIKKETKFVIAEYIENLQQALPQIEPILLKKALSGDIIAIKEIHDRTMGKPKLSIEHSANDETINIILDKLANLIK